MKPIPQLLLLLASLSFVRSYAQENMPLKSANAKIENKKTVFYNAQSGISIIGGGAYSTLTIVFSTSDGESMTITLATNKTFGQREFRVRPVSDPGIENAQMTYRSNAGKVFEAAGSTGTGSVSITRLKNDSVEGIFSGRFKQRKSENTIEIVAGHFHATLTKPDPE